MGTDEARSRWGFRYADQDAERGPRVLDPPGSRRGDLFPGYVQFPDLFMKTVPAEEVQTVYFFCNTTKSTDYKYPFHEKNFTSDRISYRHLFSYKQMTVLATGVGRGCSCIRVI